MDDYIVLSIIDFRGGLSPEANRGPRGAFRYGYGLDIRNGANSLKCNQALKKDSASIVTDLVLTGFRASDGNEYAFGDTGKIYKKSAGTWSLVYTEGGGKITGAAEFTHNDGGGNYVSYLVWATQTTLRRTTLSDTTFASVATVGSFSVGSASYPHSMRMAVGSLMITDSQFMALLDYEGNFNNQALQIVPGNNGKSLQDRNDTLIIGTQGSFDPEGWLFTWDGGVTADSWILKRPAQGNDVNAMIPLEGGMLLQVGEKGHLRFWNYADVSPLTRCLYSAWAYPGGVTEFNTIPHIGMNGGTANGVYSLGRLNKNDVLALNLEYIPSHGKLTGTEIGSIWKDGDDLYVSWKDGSTYGIDIIDHDNKAPAVYQSLLMDVKRPEIEKMLKAFKMTAASAIPEGCEVAIKYRTTRTLQTDDTWQDTKRSDDIEVMEEGDIATTFDVEGQGEQFEIEVTLTPNGNDTPEITGIFAFLNLGDD